ncbi:OTU domain-containing protein 4 [Aulostomus maculatus]
MSRGGSTREERGADQVMDDYLKSIGLHRKSIAKDGSCLFRAVAEQVLHCQSLHTRVRAECVEYLKEHRDTYEAFVEGDFEDYLQKLQDPQHWVGEVEINALAVMYRRDFLIFQEPGKPAVNITGNNFREQVKLCFLNGNHYDSVYHISRVKNAALCQSILYELLYAGVFGVNQSALASCRMSGRASEHLSDDSMPACASSDESDLDTGEILWSGNATSLTATRPAHQSSTRVTHTHTRPYISDTWRQGRGRSRLLSERLRRSLNPTLLRNVEYDVWHKFKKAQQKRDYCIAAGMQYAVGDRCQVHLEGCGRIYNATIKEVPAGDGLVTVYTEEQKELQVPLWTLRQPSLENSGWSTVVNRDRKLSNGHEEWEERGRCHPRGKMGTVTSSVAQATVPGSSSRMQKQHSWPPQAPVEEQGGARASRKSGNLMEPPSFGLTEKERLAKEEEERNVALVEIQLRDEHSFPALGSQVDASRRKPGEKKRSQRHKMKSASPSVGDRHTSSTPPATLPINPTPPGAPSINPTLPAAPSINPTLPAAPSAPAAQPTNPTPPVPLSAPAAPPINPTPPGAPSINPTLPASLSAPAALPINPTPPVPPSAPAAPPIDPNLPVAQSAPAACAAPPIKTPPAAPPVSSNVNAAWLSSLKPLTPNINMVAAESRSTSSLLPPSSASSTKTSCFSFLTPLLPAASSPPPSSNPSPSSSSLPLLPSSSPLLSLTLPPPTFISPIAPPPQGSFLPRSSPPITSLPLSLSPTAPSSSSPSDHAPQVLETPPLPPPAPTQNSLPNTGGPLMVSQSQTLELQVQTHSSLPPCQTQMSTGVQSSLPLLQNCPQSHIQVPSLSLNQSQIQAPTFQVQPQSQAQYMLPSQSDVVQAQFQDQYVPQSQSDPPASRLPQCPHPSQVPHSPPTSLQSPIAQNQTEAPPTVAQQTAAHLPLKQLQHPRPSHHPPIPSIHPLTPNPLSSVSGAGPLQQLSQLYQDPLYPGFPQRQTGDLAQTPPFSSCRSGNDLPQDINILRFFFNLGVRAYLMPMVQPYIYLLPLQQANALHPRPRSRSPSPTLHYAPTRHQNVYPQYPSSSATLVPQCDHHVSSQPLPPEHSHQNDPSRYPATQAPPHQMPSTSLPWQQPHLFRNSSYPTGYHTPSPPYQPTQPLSLGCQPTLYPLSMTPYLPSSIRYQSPTTEELQAQQLHHGNGGTMSSRGPTPLDGSAASPNNRTVVVSAAFKKEQQETLKMSVDPTSNIKPTVLVHQSETKDVPASMTSLQKSNSTPDCPEHYDITPNRSSSNNNSARVYTGHGIATNSSKAFAPVAEPEGTQGGYMAAVARAEHPSVSCSAKDRWEESEGFRPPTSNLRGSRRGFRGGGKGRGGYKRRRGGMAGERNNYSQHNSSHQGQGQERDY